MSVDMGASITLTVVQLSLITGLSLWTSIELVNNLVGYRGALNTVGRIMRMSLLTEPPVVNTALLHRRVESSRWHRVAHALLILILALTAALLWRAVYSYVAVLAGYAHPDSVIALTNLAVAAFIGLGFFLTLGGLWFGYWIKQETLQLTHFVLICMGIATGILVNLPRLAH